jgi:hypothetical protein
MRTALVELPSAVRPTTIRQPAPGRFRLLQPAAEARIRTLATQIADA